MSDALANAARLLSEPARAVMLLRLMDGRAVPAGELALWLAEKLNMEDTN
jgi:hypothetical protein